MYRYLIRLFKKILYLLRYIITQSTYILLISKNWNYKLITTYFILVIFSTTVLIYNQSNSNIISNLLSKTSIVEDEIIQCRFPQLSLNSNKLNFTISNTLQPKCRSWFHPIVIDNYNVRLIVSHLNCTVIFYLGEGDGEYEKVSIRLLYNVSIVLLSDYFTVQCEDDIKKILYPNLPYASIHYNPNIRKRLASVKKNEDDFNVLILGLDSVSRLQFERMLPQTFDYITKELNGIVLKGYNILGDGTPQQLIPMLTGFKETELPSTLYRDRNGSFVDIYPFIWNKYHQQGYVTGYAEDRVEYGTWTLRLKGFKKTPTDHYLLPFYRMGSTKSLLYRRNAYCIRNETSFDIFLSYIEQFWLSYSENKKFFFAFFKQYTHDGYTATSILDLSLLKFLKNLNQTNDYEKTIIILMTDHGARFSIARQTPQGKLEERLPFMSFIFPKLFKKKYSKEIKILQKNIFRLTTPFDIHSTLLSLINMNQINDKVKNYTKQRNISLFHLIPAQRTCDDLNLEPHWCSCLQWENLNINDTKVKQATKHMISYINKQLLLVKNNLCHQLQFHSIHNAQVYQPNQALLRFSRSSDIDGRIPTYNDKNTHIIFYQITFETQPNKAIYEATTQYSNRSNKFYTDLNHISRLNAYKSSASCIERDYSYLRKFCYCIK
ncbi:unnamed protein product [Rotaria sordida]|uniref:DUF229 domain containing protein n=1 Tax=Rotaria sordida TaxID=392033 RepID=A0A813NTC2_9BILA|nr:unnamed protein product [Rotaria sordida]